MPVALIFGVNGQDGFYLKRLLHENLIDTIGISRYNSEVIGDVSNYNFVHDLIKKHKPQYIFNFAANSTSSHDAAFENLHTISLGTFNILEVCRIYTPNAKIFIAGSALQFKNENIPINEQTEFDPNSIYSVARIQSVEISRFFRNKFNLNIYFGYLFNHDSSFRSLRHVNMKIIDFVRNNTFPDSKKLELGNIFIKKEFGFAEDIVNAIWKFVNQNEIFEIVIGTGKAYSIIDWLEISFSLINDDWTKYVVHENPTIHETNILVSDPQKINSIGWLPKIDIHQLAYIMYNNKT